MSKSKYASRTFSPIQLSQLRIFVEALVTTGKSCWNKKLGNYGLAEQLKTFLNDENGVQRLTDIIFIQVGQRPNVWQKAISQDLKLSLFVTQLLDNTISIKFVYDTEIEVEASAFIAAISEEVDKKRAVGMVA